MTRANLKVTDYDVVGRPHGDDIAVLAAPLSIVLTGELDGACTALGVTVDDVLVATLGRAIARTVGEGVVAVDAPGHGRTTYPMSLPCVGPEQTSATEMLASVHHTVAAAYLRRIVHGVPDEVPARPESEILFAHGTEDPARLGHALELRAYRHGDVLALDWWYDTRSFEPYTVQELSEQFPYALIELTSEATAPVLVAEMAMAH